mmetsp:Transcript_1612/g.1573  ORF Transcript_1612/g.1573 Transcript_1612/m.1573 type:complete len:132 (+) Transcript_1612:244-639(+)
MISMMKDSWVHELNRLSIADSRSSEASTTLNKELSAYLRNELITGEMKNMLDEISLYDFSKHTGSNIQHRAQGEIMWINYTQPSLREYKYYDTKWFCPILFQNLSLENFIMALFGIMLEKSIIFISKDVQY